MAKGQNYSAMAAVKRNLESQTMSLCAIMVLIS
jgi:hypothetical protein